jgi:hypothetical protein
MNSEQKPEPIVFENCYLDEPQGDGYLNVCTQEGSPIFSVGEDSYPKGTHFDVTITYVVKPPKTAETGPRLVKK